jgi:hypothetical protein
MRPCIAVWGTIAVTLLPLTAAAQFNEHDVNTPSCPRRNMLNEQDRQTACTFASFACMRENVQVFANQSIPAEQKNRIYSACIEDKMAKAGLKLTPPPSPTAQELQRQQEMQQRVLAERSQRAQNDAEAQQAWLRSGASCAAGKQMRVITVQPGVAYGGKVPVGHGQRLIDTSGRMTSNVLPSGVVVSVVGEGPPSSYGPTCKVTVAPTNAVGLLPKGSLVPTG